MNEQQQPTSTSDLLREGMERTEAILAKDPEAGVRWLREQAEKQRRLFGRVLTREDFRHMSREEAETVRILMVRPLSEIPPRTEQEAAWETWFDSVYYRSRELYGAEVMDSLSFEEKYRRYYAVATPEERELMRAYVRDATRDAYNQSMRDAYQRVLTMLDTMEDPEQAQRQPLPREPEPEVPPALNPEPAEEPSHLGTYRLAVALAKTSHANQKLEAICQETPADSEDALAASSTLSLLRARERSLNAAYGNSVFLIATFVATHQKLLTKFPCQAVKNC